MCTSGECVYNIMRDRVCNRTVKNDVRARKNAFELFTANTRAADSMGIKRRSIEHTHTHTHTLAAEAE
jgi:hypothetical protein